mmetsp:Transcript_25219/g.72615  ORF Transcript_25219/g.72615 Transcript_25219/m.72615 type:complete len:264 (-) Transcript_25219:355-1146(-)
MLIDLVAQEGANVTIDGVARSVFLPRRHELLTRTLRNGDDHEALPCHHLIHVGQDVFELDLHLRDEAEVHDVRGHGRKHGDETRIATHQFHDADTFESAARLDPSIADDLRCLGNCRVEPEGLVEHDDVVVDGLRDADDADELRPLQRGLVEQVPRELCAVPADEEHDGNTEALHAVQDLLCVEAATASLQDTAALHVDVINEGRCQLDGRVEVWLCEAVVAGLHAIDLLDAILEPKVVGNATNNGVQSWAQPSTCRDSGLDY